MRMIQQHRYKDIRPAYYFEYMYVSSAVCQTRVQRYTAVRKRTSLTLEIATTDALKKAKNEGIAKIPSQRLPSVKNTTIRISKALVTPAIMLSVDRFLASISWLAAWPLSAGMAALPLRTGSSSAAVLKVLNKK